jgi:hypothetical protein
MIGTPPDVGRDFDIAATVVEEGDNARFVAWFDRANAANHYPPVAFPLSSANCPVARVTVRKTS